MFTFEEKSTLTSSLVMKRNIIETGDPYTNAIDAFRRNELEADGIKPKVLGKTELEEIIKINRLIIKIETA